MSEPRTIESNRNLPTMNISEWVDSAIRTMKAQKPHECKPLLMIGPTGVGKTQAVAQVAPELKASLVVKHLGQVPPLEIGGVGLDQATRSLYFAKSPLLNEVMGRPAPRILFLDEVDRILGPGMNSLMQLLTPERAHCGYVFEDTYVIGAANAWYGTYTTEFDKAFLSRFAVAHIRSDVQGWLRWAIEHKVHPSIILTISLCPDVLHEESEQTAGAYKVADERAWADLSRTLWAVESIESTLSEPEIAMYVGLHAAQQHVTYQQLGAQYAEHIKIAAAGKKVSLIDLSKADAAKVMFAIYLCAAGMVETLDECVPFLRRGITAIGGEKMWVVGRLLTYKFDPVKMMQHPEIHKIRNEEMGL